MFTANEMAYVNYSAGIDYVSGALSKPKKDGQHNHEKMLLANHRVAATTNPQCNRIYLRKPTKRTTPLSPKELQIRARFTSVAAMIKTRKEDLSKITDDQIAFAAQKDQPGGKKTMLSWYWKVCGAEYDQTHNG